mmetsp:Transcript_61018/g.178485  ORF Transcript_61018/g.178485 Transcript_61018/m.178485 type:complete len:401 (-) Transcript_61018:484-1686(-)
MPAEQEVWVLVAEAQHPARRFLPDPIRAAHGPVEPDGQDLYRGRGVPRRRLLRHGQKARGARFLGDDRQVLRPPVDADEAAGRLAQALAGTLERPHLHLPALPWLPQLHGEPVAVVRQGDRPSDVGDLELADQLRAGRVEAPAEDLAAADPADERQGALGGGAHDDGGPAPLGGGAGADAELQGLLLQGVARGPDDDEALDGLAVVHLQEHADGAQLWVHDHAPDLGLDPQLREVQLPDGPALAEAVEAQGVLRAEDHLLVLRVCEASDEDLLLLLHGDGDGGPLADLVQELAHVRARDAGGLLGDGPHAVQRRHVRRVRRRKVRAGAEQEPHGHWRQAGMLRDGQVQGRLAVGGQSVDLALGLEKQAHHVHAAPSLQRGMQKGVPPRPRQRPHHVCTLA